MAYERSRASTTTRGDSLDVFVSNKLDQYTKQLSIRNAEEENKYAEAVLVNNISLEEQLNYRTAQLGRVGDDPTERRRIRGEISTLKNMIEQKKFNDEYTSKLIDFESGISSIDSVIDYLKTSLTLQSDQAIKDAINKQLLEMTDKRFEIQKSVIENQTAYALKDKTVPIIDAQIKRVTEAKNKALLSGDDLLVSTYDLNLQALNQGKTQSSIERDLKDFSVMSITGYHSAVSSLDALNAKIGQAATDIPVTIAGVTYDSAKEFWTAKRDSYVADQGPNGFFASLKAEKVDALKTANSKNLLSPLSIQNSTNDFSSLEVRPELQSYTTQLNSLKSDIQQTGVDLVAKSVYLQYTNDYDLNKALTEMTKLEKLGNVTDDKTKLINAAGQIKDQQVTGILQTTQEILKNNPGLDPAQAVAQAVSQGAGAVVSPTQSTTKTEQQIATETVKGAQSSSYVTDPRTTANTPTNVTPTTPPPVVPTVNDLSAKYGKVGNAIYRKSDGYAFKNSDEFFADAGINSYQNTKFDTAYKPPAPNASPQLNSTPAASPSPVKPAAAAPATYKVASGDTLSAISKKLLGDANRYMEIAKANNISNPNLIKIGQELIIPK